MTENGNRPIDLSSLDPTRDRARFERVVGSINARARGELAARRGQTNAIAMLARWKRPMLAAAAMVALISGTILFNVRVPQPYFAPQTDGIAEAMGIPEALAQWIDADGLPTTADWISAF